jgi:hypothetical protein
VAPFPTLFFLIRRGWNDSVQAAGSPAGNCIAIYKKENKLIEVHGSESQPVLGELGVVFRTIHAEEYLFFFFCSLTAFHQQPHLCAVR